MTTLLVIIYLAFISLGLPDAIMGAAWPMIYQELGVPIAYAGISAMLVAGGTVLSSLFSANIIARFGTGKVTVISVSLTAIGLIGISLSSEFVMMCVFAIPLGIGAGSVDTALNNFVALHYKARHMNWLHCFWGIGATAGPTIIAFTIANSLGWRIGYGAIAILQISLIICLVASLRLWNRVEKKSENEIEEEKQVSVSIKKLLSLKGAKPALASFFCYGTIEILTGFWGATYLVMSHHIKPEIAAQWIALYYFGITVGRFLSGFVTLMISNKNLIRIGQIFITLGIIILMIPNISFLPLIGLILIGLGCAPIFPSMLHETPQRFGKQMSQGIMGIQMATSYIGVTLMPPLFGFVAAKFGFVQLSIWLLALVLTMIITTEMVNRK